MFAPLLPVFALASVLSSCWTIASGSESSFIVVNLTGRMVDSLCIEPDEKAGYWSLEPGDSMLYVSEMEGHPKVDGSYRLGYIEDKRRKGLVFGYFSNGIPSERRTRVVLMPDTVVVEHRH